MLAYHENSVEQALQDLFPSIWYVPANQQSFFQAYAKQNGFDPLHPDGWYAQPFKKLTATKVVFLFLYVLYCSLFVVGG